jgi:lactoylglutathione lyase
MFESAFPIISTPDLARSLSFYRDLLGGVIVYQFPPDGEAVYVGLDIGSSHLGIGQDPNLSDDRSAQRFSIWVYAADCDAAVEMLRSAGTQVLQEPADQPWGERVARVGDPDGNVIVIGSRPEGTSA